MQNAAIDRLDIVHKIVQRIICKVILSESKGLVDAVDVVKELGGQSRKLRLRCNVLGVELQFDAAESYLSSSSKSEMSETQSISYIL